MAAEPLLVRTTSTAGTPPALVVLDREGARGVDRAAIEECSMPGVVLMENAAASLASVCDRVLRDRGAARDALVLLLAGPGNNGGDAFAAARRLRNAGRTVVVALLREPSDPGSDAAINLRILRALREPTVEIHAVARGRHTLDAIVDQLDIPALVVDGMLGTGLDRPLADPYLASVAWLNDLRAHSGAPVVAVDLPTGLDADTGAILGDCVRADETVTFAGLKKGFFAPNARAFLGVVTVADIGAPAELLARFGAPPAPGVVQPLL